jgi:GT2 family glycosyltransferase
MTTPLVSVLVPAFNSAPWLREALDSILAQSYPRIEVLLLDDASTDETPGVAAEYEGRIRYVRQPKNLGIYDNVNVGIDLAQGEFIATYHADDIYEPTIVEREVEYLERHPEVGAVFCSDTFVDAQGREYGRLSLPPEVRGARPLDYRTVLNTLLTYKNRFLVCPSAMVRASVHREVGGYRQSVFRNSSDLDMWLRIARAYPIAVLEEHLMRYRHFHENSSGRYHRLRTAPENYFAIMDTFLREDGSPLATADALTSYEAHRSQDRIMAAISHYILKQQPGARAALRQVRLRPILGSRHVQRARLVILYATMMLLSRLPTIGFLERTFRERWHVKRPPKLA